MTDARAFRGFRFPAEVILWAVRWYLQFPVSYRDLERHARRPRRRGRPHRPVPLGPALRPRAREAHAPAPAAVPWAVARRRDLVSGGRLGSLLRHEAGSARTRRETTSLRRRWRARPRHRALAEIGRYRRPPFRDEPAPTRWIGAQGRFARGRAPWCFSASTCRRAGWTARSWPPRAAGPRAGDPSATTRREPNGPRPGRRRSRVRPRPTRT